MFNSKVIFKRILSAPSDTQHGEFMRESVNSEMSIATQPTVLLGNVFNPPNAEGTFVQSKDC